MADAESDLIALRNLYRGRKDIIGTKGSDPSVYVLLYMLG